MMVSKKAYQIEIIRYSKYLYISAEWKQNQTNLNDAAVNKVNDDVMKWVVNNFIINNELS